MLISNDCNSEVRIIATQIKIVSIAKLSNDKKISKESFRGNLKRRMEICNWFSFFLKKQDINALAAFLIKNMN